MDQDTVLRLATAFGKEIDESKADETKINHPARAFAAFLRVLGEEKVRTQFGELLKRVVSEHCYSAVLVEAVKGTGLAAEVLVPTWKGNAGSSSFATANAFAIAAPDLANLFAEIISAGDACEMVVEICRAAHIGAWESQALRNSRFTSVPKLRDSARRYAAEHYESAQSLVETRLSVDFTTFLARYLSEPEQLQESTTTRTSSAESTSE